MNSSVYNEDWQIALKGGQVISMRGIFEMFYQPLFYFANRLIQNTQEAEDIVVETFIKLLRKRADFDNLPDAKSFLFVAVRNACLDYLKSKKRRIAYHNELKYLTPTIDTIEREWMKLNLLNEIYQQIKNLPQQCGKIISSLYIEGKNTAEVAAEMNLSPQTVLNQKAKAVRIIRHSLASKSIISPEAVLP